MTDPLFGKIWKLNQKKTVFSTNFRPNTETRLYEDLPNGYKLTVEGISSGQPYKWWYIAMYDDNPHAVHGRADVDAITIYRVNERITFGFFEKNGESGGPYGRRLSLDGHSLLVDAAGRHPDGSPFYDVLHYNL
jgi:hypothetical protein